jgi:hypothetical protein
MVVWCQVPGGMALAVPFDWRGVRVGGRATVSGAWPEILARLPGQAVAASCGCAVFDKFPSRPVADPHKLWKLEAPRQSESESEPNDATRLSLHHAPLVLFQLGPAILHLQVSYAKDMNKSWGMRRAGLRA